MTDTTDTQLLDVTSVAAAVSVDPATVRRWIREGRLHAIRAGGQWRITEAALQAFLAQDRRLPRYLEPEKAIPWT